MMRIDPSSLSRADAMAFRESELAQMESARLVAGIASGSLKRRARAASAAHHANVMALSIAIDGPIPPDIAAMSMDDLMATLSAEYDGNAEISPVETQEAAEGTAEPVEPVSPLSGPEIAPIEPVSNRDELPEPGLADQVAALAAMVEDMRAQLAAMRQPSPVETKTPVVEMTTEPAGDVNCKRTPAHERAIRMAWEHRRQARLQRAIAEDHMRMREQVQEELRRAHLQAGGDRIWLRKRRKWALMLARDLRAKLRRQESISLDRLRQIAEMSARPHHMGQPVAMDDYQRLMRERDAAQASLASEREKRSQLRRALDRGTDMLEVMTERALRAENALRAVEARRERAGTPYRANVRAVTFGAAA